MTLLEKLRDDPYAANHAVEFYSPFRVTSEGVESPLEGFYAPDVYHSDTDDIEILSDDWVALTGYTGQYRYRGACLHASEFFGGGLARDVLSDVGGVYVLVPVEVYPDPCEGHEYADVSGTTFCDGDCRDPEPAGWAVLRYRGES